MPSRALHLLVATFLVGACQAPASLPGPPSGPVTPGDPVPGQTADARPGVVPGATATVLEGTVAVGGHPVPGATVSLTFPTESRQGLPLAVSDGDGRFRLDLPAGSRPAFGLLTAQTADFRLLGVVRMPSLAVQAVGPGVQVDEASSIVARKILVKLVECHLSGADLPEGRKRLERLIGDGATLTAVVRDLVSGNRTFPHVPLMQAIDQVRRRPDYPALETVVTLLVDHTEVALAFDRLVTAANQVVIANLQQGGQLILPTPWQVGRLRVDPPQISIGTQGLIAIGMAGAPGQFSFVMASPESVALAREFVDTISRLYTSLGNPVIASPVLQGAASGGGGGGGGGGGSTGGPADLASLVAVTRGPHSLSDVYWTSQDTAAVAADGFVRVTRGPHAAADTTWTSIDTTPPSPPNVPVSATVTEGNAWTGAPVWRDP